MAQQFKLGDSLVDLSRNQITRNGQSERLPPKALAVLACLAEHQGNVVSIDTVMTTVWPDIVVSPNTLQRSVTQLRKALGDDGKTQNIIQTHSKQGYSLECPVIWLDAQTPTPQVQASTETQPTQHRSKFNTLVAAVVGIMVVMVLGFSSYSSRKPQLSFNHLTQITATDAKETGASYSSDGRYIIFHRFVGRCQNHIWAKDLTTRREIQLTEQYGLYRNDSYSKDGKQLIFMARETCVEKVQPANCWNLMTLDLTTALLSPQTPKLKVSCKVGQMDRPYWINNTEIVVLLKQDERWRLVKFQPGSNKPVVLYSPSNKRLYSLSHSAKRDQLAVMSINDDGEHVVDILTTQGELLSSSVVRHPTEMTAYRHIYPSFDPNREQLLFSTGKRLFSLAFDGSVKPITSATSHHIYTPRFHPAQDKLVASYGVYDSDIAIINPDSLAAQSGRNGFNQVETPYPSIQRSVFTEQNGRFQPDGNLIAYVSERSGTMQLWLTDHSEARQLTEFAVDSGFRGLDWHNDGKSLLLVVDGLLYQVTLDKTIKPLPLMHEITQLFQFSQNNLLMEINDSTSYKVVLYNLSNNEITTLLDQDVRHAALSSDGQLIFLDNQYSYWRKGLKTGLGELQQIPGIGGLNSAKRFVIDRDIIYSINHQDRLWSYDLKSQSYHSIRKLDGFVSYISDKRAEQLLISQVISFKKDIIELSNQH